MHMCAAGGKSAPAVSCCRYMSSTSMMQPSCAGENKPGMQLITGAVCCRRREDGNGGMGMKQQKPSAGKADSC
jgi:hypothetical protein